MTDYERFLAWCEEQGLTFPCTSGEFYARAAAYAAAYAAGDDVLIDALCEHGIGPDWLE